MSVATGAAAAAPAAKNIYEALAGVYADVAFVAKERSPRLDYSFASEAAIIAAVRPAFVAHGIVLAVISAEQIGDEVFTTRQGAAMNRVRVRLCVRLTHAPSGTHIDVQALGEGADAGDKALPKALTGAYKYAIRQTLCLETGDDPDLEPSAEQERSGASGATLPPVRRTRHRGPVELPPVPVCPEHGTSRESRDGGYFCPRKLPDDTFCTWKSPSGLPAGSADELEFE